MSKMQKMLRGNPFVSTTLSVLASVLAVSGIVYAATTIGNNVSIDGTLTQTGIATFNGSVHASSTMLVTGAVTHYGNSTFGDAATDVNLFTGTLQASTTALFTNGLTAYSAITLQNGETISNATDGVVQFNGIASSTSVTLLNGETITNATNGIVAVGGNLLINGARTNNISGEEKFLNVTGNLTGTGDGSTNAKTWVIQASATRLAGADTVNGDMDEAILKGSITNKATANEANYIMRGLNIGATNRDGGNVNKLHGGLISATQKGSSAVVTDLWGLGIKVEQDSPNTTVPTNIYGLNVEYDVVMASPTNSAGVRVYDNSDTGLTKPLAGFQVSASALASKWQYGLVIDSGAASTADIRLSNGANIYSGTAVTRAAVQTATGNDAPIGSIYVGDTAVATTRPNLYVKILDVDGGATNWERIVTQAAD